MKTCIHCQQTKPLDAFNKYKRAKDGRSATCKACRNARETATRDKDAERARYHENKERHKQKRQQYAKQNAETIRARVKDWREKNPEKLRASKKRYVKKKVETAKDGYIKHLLTSGTDLCPAHIPQALVECKRLELQISRYVKELK